MLFGEMLHFVQHDIVFLRERHVMLSVAKHLIGIAVLCGEGRNFVQHDNLFTRPD